MLVKTLHQFKQVDATVASSGLKKLQLHLWYLTEEMVPLSLFDDRVTDTEKAKIASALLKTKVSDVSVPKKRKGNGKPIFPADVNENSSLADLTGEDSWYFFQLMEIETGFLLKDVEEWSHDEQYLAAKKQASMITVVNDCAERGIKLATDLQTSAQFQKNFESNLQVVEKSRSSQPNLRKRPPS